LATFFGELSKALILLNLVARDDLMTQVIAQKIIEVGGRGVLKELTLPKLPFPIHAHMLRHAAGYALAARGIDTRTLQAFMGHRSIATRLFTPQ
jgi:site-specific recombinase XerD